MEQTTTESGDNPSPELEVESFSKQAFQSLITLTRLSHDLPQMSSDYDYYSSFPGFRFFSSKMQQRIFSLIQGLSQGVNPVLSRFGRTTHGNNSPPELEELFEKLVETNDAGIEQVGHLIDILNGVAPPPPVAPSYPLVVQPDLVPPPSYTAPSPYSAALPGTSQLPQWNRLEYTAAPLNHWARGQMSRSNRIQKPQICREGVDNSDAPFIPSLRGGMKPNSLHSNPVSSDHSSLDDLLTKMRSQGPERLHPYFEELQEVNYSPSLFSSSDPDNPGPLDNHTYELVSTEERLDALVEQLKQSTEIAIDLEHHDYRSYLGFTCLVQITVKGHDYIIDPLRVGQSMHRLLDPFTNPAIVKILHGADHDVQWLQRDFGLYLVGMFDTHQASVLLNLPKRSLAFLLNYCCNVKASKKFQMADWRDRPLPQLMERYAREDTHYLLYIYHRMRNELIRRSTDSVDLLKEALDKSRLVCLKVYTKPVFNSWGHFKVISKNAHSFSAIQREACRALYAWRDRTAREKDESCEYVLPGTMLFQITDKMPEDMHGILACCNPIPPILSNCIHEVAMVYNHAKRNFIETGRSMYIPALERRSRRLSSSETQSIPKRPNVLEVAMEQSNDSNQFTPTINHSINISEAVPTLNTLLMSPTQEETERSVLVSEVLATFQDPFRHFLMKPQSGGDSIKHDLQEPISHSSDAILEQDVIYLAPDKDKPSSHGMLTFSTAKSHRHVNTPALEKPEVHEVESRGETEMRDSKRKKLSDEKSNEVVLIGKMSREEEKKEGGNRGNGVTIRSKKNRKKPFNPNTGMVHEGRGDRPFQPFDYSAVPPPYQPNHNSNRMRYNPPVSNRHMYRPHPHPYPHPPCQFPRWEPPWGLRGGPPFNRFPPPQQFVRHHGVPWPS